MSKIITNEQIENLKALIRNRNSYLDIKEVLNNLEDVSQDVKLDESQAPKIPSQVEVNASKVLGDVSGCPDILNNVNLLEELSSLEHEQWMAWSKNIVNSEKISEDRMDRWAGLWKSYNKLTTEQKEQDRVWARKVVEIIAQEILKHKDCKVMHNLGKHGMGEMTCLDKVLESLGYSELNTTRRFFSSQP